MKNLIHRVAVAGLLLALPALAFFAQEQKKEALEPNQIVGRDFRVDWLRKNAVNIRTVDPKDQDFSDLAPLKKAIGDSRIVMLGESTHGEGGTALGKARMVEFLHQKMGFDVLVFEGGLYDMTKVWESIKKGDVTYPALRQGVMAAWSGSEQSQTVFDYLAANANSKRPIEIAGFDAQVTGPASSKFLIKELTAYLKEASIASDLVTEGNRSRAILEDAFALKYWKGTPYPEAAEQEAFFSSIQRLVADINNSNPPEDKRPLKSFWLQAVKNLTTSSRLVLLNRAGDKTSPLHELGQEREKQGADNMLWLANERYPGRKIIVWAATWHIFRNKGLQPSEKPTAEDIEFSSKYTSHRSMGERVSDKFGKDVYIIGFTAYGGNIGFVVGGKPAESWTGPLANNRHASIEMEELLNAAGFNYAFLDFRSTKKGAAWLKTPIRISPMGYSAGLRNWPEALDALFFIREQTFDTRATY
jgi:erythromycin esterase